MTPKLNFVYKYNITFCASVSSLQQLHQTPIFMFYVVNILLSVWLYNFQEMVFYSSRSVSEHRCVNGKWKWKSQPNQEKLNLEKCDIWQIRKWQVFLRIKL